MSTIPAIPPELFIIVRPPPSVTTSALNLQIQLVSQAFTRTAQSRRSEGVGRLASETGTTSSLDVVAATTVQSSTPGRPRASSVGSNKSNGSRGTGGTTASRTVTPLYNLRFSTVLPTIVTDAGTDTKVAKFIKKGGIEVIGLAILEPISLRPALHSTTNLSRSTSAATEASQPPTPTSSSFFSRFKKLSLKPGAVVKTLTGPGVDEPAFTAAGERVVPLFRPEATPQDTAASIKAAKLAGKGGYVWTVKKWLRPDLEEETDLVDIRFEWRRGTKRARSRRPPSTAGSHRTFNTTAAVQDPANITSSRPQSTRSRQSIEPARLPTGAYPDSGPNTSRRNSVESYNAGDETVRPRHLLPQKHSLRPNSYSAGAKSPESERSRSPAPMWEDGEYAEGDRELDEDSDVEDSDRPWVCHVVIEATSTRIHLCTLTPSPHHPKLVAHLAIPYYLRPLSLSPIGDTHADDGLSVEEMKDAVSAQALWLILRENLGGSVVKRK